MLPTIAQVVTTTVTDYGGVDTAATGAGGVRCCRVLQVDDSPVSTEDVVSVGAVTTVCVADLASLELSPPLTDSSSAGSDVGVWISSSKKRTRTDLKPLVQSKVPRDRSRDQLQQPVTIEDMCSDVMQRACLVCGDAASGHHYGILSCEACKAFFKRTVQERMQYNCTVDGLCDMTKKSRKACPACRYEKCLNMGMNPEGIRLDRRKGGRHKHMRVQQQQSMDNSVYGSSGIACSLKTMSSTTSSVIDVKQSAMCAGDNPMLFRLLRIEPPKVFALPDPSVPDSQQKFMTTLSNLADRELVATIGWAKHIPGFSSLPLADEMNIIQTTWIYMLCFNLSYRSSIPYEGYLVFSDDLKVAEDESEGCGIWPELDNVARGFAKKLESLHVTKEEFVLLKATILLNADIQLENPDKVQTLRDQLFDSLLEYESCQCGPEAFHRVSRLMLTLPMLTQLVILGRQYWLTVKTYVSNAVTSNRLLNEMVESISTDELKDELPTNV